MASGTLARHGLEKDPGRVEADVLADDNVASRKILSGLIGGEGGDDPGAREVNASGPDADGVDGFLAGVGSVMLVGCS